MNFYYGFVYFFRLLRKKIYIEFFNIYKYHYSNNQSNTLIQWISKDVKPFYFTNTASEKVFNSTKK